MKKFILMLTLLLVMLAPQFAKADSICEGYRPLHAAFGLTGYHATTLCACSSCHLGGIWKGTPNTCASCHSGNRPPAIGPTPTHIPVPNAQCSTCHTTTAFAPANMTHDPATVSPPGSCLNCHNGQFTSIGAMKKSNGHIPTTASCDVCHTSTKNWDANWTHQTVSAGTCDTCHNGTYARGPVTNHIPFGTTSCDACHNGYITFANGIYTHTGGEVCETCHTGNHKGASMKPINHPVTPDNCSNCHSITGWPCKTGTIDYWWKYAKWAIHKYLLA